jgi:hypothetical protein
MKAILEFNLPDDQQDFDLAVSSMKFWSVLFDLDQSLRAKTKYAPDNLPQDKYDAYQEIRDELRELMSNNDISFDMVH